MDIAPYKFIDGPETAAIVLSRGRKKFNQVYRILFPIFLVVSSVLFLFVLDKRDMPGWTKWFPLLLIIISVFILFSTYTAEMRFNNKEIVLEKRNTFKRSRVVLPVDQQKHITTSSRANRDGGNIFHAVDKHNKKIVLLVIPFMYMNKEKMGFIAQAISEKTGLPIVNL